MTFQCVEHALDVFVGTPLPKHKQNIPRLYPAKIEVLSRIVPLHQKDEQILMECTLELYLKCKHVAITYYITKAYRVT